MQVELVVEEPEDDFSVLVDELASLDVDSVERLPAGPAPPDTRAGEVAPLGALAVTLGAPVLERVIRVVQDWLRRRRSGTLKIKIGQDEIELSGVSTGAQQRALDAFLARHTG